MEETLAISIPPSDWTRRPLTDLPPALIQPRFQFASRAVRRIIFHHNAALADVRGTDFELGLEQRDQNRLAGG